MMSHHPQSVEQSVHERKAKSGKRKEVVDYFSLFAFRFPLLTSSIGLSHLALQTGREITDLAAEVHSVITRRWLMPDTEADARQAPLPYHIVAHTFSVLASWTAALPHASEHTATPDTWRRFVSALNGIMGDKLAAWNNALAIEMSVRGADGGALQLAELRARSDRKSVV